MLTLAAREGRVVHAPLHLEGGLFHADARQGQKQGIPAILARGCRVGHPHNGVADLDVLVSDRHHRDVSRDDFLDGDLLETMKAEQATGFDVFKDSGFSRTFLYKADRSPRLKSSLLETTNGQATQVL